MTITAVSVIEVRLCQDFPTELEQEGGEAEDLSLSLWSLSSLEAGAAELLQQKYPDEQ